jgi:hypothetical protein
MYKRYTPEEIRFIKSKVKGRSCAELVELFNRRFGASVTEGQMKSFMGNHKLRNGRDGRFRPGQVPFNKGRKGVNQGGTETQFKPGHRPWNWHPVGTERTTCDGYVEVKIAEPRKWKGKQAVIWEAANGPVPKGHAVIFADGDKTNLKLKNLLLVSRKELAVMNRLGLIHAFADGTKAGKIIADIRIKIAERKRGAKKRKRGKRKGVCKNEQPL